MLNSDSQCMLDSVLVMAMRVKQIAVQIATVRGESSLFALTPQNITGKQICGGREGPGSPGDNIVTDGGRRRVN